MLLVLDVGALDVECNGRLYNDSGSCYQLWKDGA
jgi:hypothetical protein